MTAPGRRTADDATFAVHLAGWEAREADPDGAVERVARAICTTRGHTWGRLVPGLADEYRREALAALHAMRPAPQVDTAAAVEPCGEVMCVEAAKVRRVEALAAELAALADLNDESCISHNAAGRSDEANYRMGRSVSYMQAATKLRAALAQPAPATDEAIPVIDPPKPRNHHPRA